jgi:hypothetical protein
MALRNPGPNMFAPEMRAAITDALDKNEITEIVLMPHTQCGAMGAVDDALRLNRAADPLIYASLIRPFKDKGIAFKDRDDLESTANPSAQKAELERLIRNRRAVRKAGRDERAGDIRVVVKLWDPHRIMPSVPEDYGNHKHTTLVANPSETRYGQMFKSVSELHGKHVNMWGTYVIQPADVAAIKLAVIGLGIRDVILYAASGEDAKEMKRLEEELETKRFMNGVMLSVVGGTKNTGKHLRI